MTDEINWEKFVMDIKNDKIILRDMVVSDIDDVILWNTVETEWMLWDAPWEHEEENHPDWDAYRKQKTIDIAGRKKDDELRERFEICLLDEQEKHVGSISCYFIDDAYRIVDYSEKIAIGMCIYDETLRGHGYGKAAYLLYCEYLKKQGYAQVYTQKWSGNLPLIKMAERIGFQECNRYIGLRQVRGQVYDGLTFVLNINE